MRADLTAMGQDSPRTRRRFDGVLIAFVVLAAGISMLALAGDTSSPSSEFMGVPVLSVLAAAAVVVGIVRWQPPNQRAWWWIAVGLGFLAMGEVVSWGYEQFSSNAFPSMADAFHLAAYPALAAGLLGMASDREVVKDRSAILDASIVAAAAALLLWLVLIQEYAQNPLLSTLQKSFSIAYPGADVLLFALAVRLLFGFTTRSLAVVGLLAAIGAMLVGDTLFAVADLHVGYSRTGFVEGWILASYVLFGLAGLHRSIAQPLEPNDTDETMKPYRVLLLVFAAIVPPMLGLAHEAGWWKERDANVAVAVATIVVSTLVLFRMWGLTKVIRALAERRGRDRFEAMIRHSQDVIAVVQPDGTLDYASPATTAQWGFEPEARVGTDLAVLVPSEETASLREHLRLTAAQPRAGTHEFETRLRRRDGEIRLLEIVATNLLDDTNVGGLVLTMRDITGQKALEQELAHQAFHDSLTSLANRALFFDRVSHAVVRHGRDLAGHVAVLFIDLDDFKSVNDGLGHGCGDQLLVAVGLRLQQCLRPGDTAARLGGDEFAVLLEERADLGAAKAVAARILEVMQLPVSVGDLELAVPASIGIAVSDSESTPNSLLRDADIAMYTAKANGKRRFEVFDASMGEHATKRLELRTELTGVLERNELRLDFQPILDVPSNRIVSVEALLRWDHPTRGTIAPLDFIPFAEESGLIVPIGRWVIETACREAAQWQHLGGHPVAVAVNMSGSQLADPGLVEHVRHSLERARLHPSCLIIELTETVLMEDTDATIQLLHALKDLGVRISVDDFGTGYCSLSYLRNFPVDDVKIDRSFIEELGRIPTSAALASNILTLASALGVTAVAEGVETEQQMVILRDLDCDFAQGFYLSRPVDASAIRDIISTRRDAVTTPV